MIVTAPNLAKPNTLLERDLFRSSTLFISPLLKGALIISNLYAPSGGLWIQLLGMTLYVCI